MRSMVKGMLGAFGLASAGQVERLSADVRSRTEKLKALEERVTRTRADAEEWKRRAEAAAKEAAALKKALEGVRHDARRDAAALAESKSRAERLQAEIKAVRARIEEATRTTTGARTQLMAIEVKLDLIESAIQVLDQRTRPTLVK